MIKSYSNWDSAIRLDTQIYGTEESRNRPTKIWSTDFWQMCENMQEGEFFQHMDLEQQPYPAPLPKHKNIPFLLYKS